MAKQKPIRLTAKQLDLKIMELKALKVDFETHRCTNKSMLIYGNELYESSTIADFNGKMLNEIKKGQQTIIEHTIQNEHLFIRTDEETKEPYHILDKDIFPIYCKAKETTFFDEKSEYVQYTKECELVQIDIKSAYLTCAHRLGFVPDSLHEHLNTLKSKWIGEGMEEQEAHDNAKKTRLVLIGSLAKKTIINQYKYIESHEEEREEYDIQTKQTEKYSVSLNGKYEVSNEIVRKNGKQLANIYFKVAECVTDTCRKVLNEVEDCCFYWVDAIFVKNNPQSIAKAEAIFAEAGYRFERYAPRRAFWNEQKSFWTVATGENDQQGNEILKKYPFPMDKVEQSFYRTLENCMRSFAKFSNKKSKVNKLKVENILHSSHTKEVYEYACKLLILNGVNPDNYFAKAYRLCNDDGKKEFVCLSVLANSEQDLQDYIKNSPYWQNKTFWEEMSGKVSTWKVQGQFLVDRASPLAPKGEGDATLPTILPTKTMKIAMPTERLARIEHKSLRKLALEAKAEKRKIEKEKEQISLQSRLKKQALEAFKNNSPTNAPFPEIKINLDNIDCPF